MNPTTKPALKKLILDALATNYTSTSCHDDIPTGNRYQSVRLGDELTPGFRGSRDAILERVKFAGNTVLDLGSNLGELSRFARRAGAELVDGVEYDSFFVELAQCVNAYNDSTRVSFRQGDITDPSLYSEPHDITLAFSVFTYLREVLPQVAEVTRKLLILETHKIANNLESAYLGPLAKLFPAHRILGSSDWGTGARHADGSRLVIAFARDAATLDALLEQDPAADVLSTSHEAELAACRKLQKEDSRVQIVDLERSVFTAYEVFRREVSDFPTADWEQLADSVLAMDLHYYSNPPGWHYWAAFLFGFFEFSWRGISAGDTAFFAYIREFFADKHFDEGFAPVVRDDAALAKRLHQRYTTMIRFRCRDFRDIPPLRAMAQVDPAQSAKIELALLGAEKTLRCRAIDGYHRVFSAFLTGVRYLPVIQVD